MTSTAGTTGQAAGRDVEDGPAPDALRGVVITGNSFGSAHERDTFRVLTSIQGVGGRLALAILSVLTSGFRQGGPPPWS